MKTLFRRMLPLLLAPFLFITLSHAHPRGKDLIFVGTYTNHGSQGIYSLRFDVSTGKLTDLQLAAPSDNPAFLAVDSTRSFLYASNETSHFKDEASGAASAFAINRHTALLAPLNEVSAHDPGPAHIAVDPTGKAVLIANYGLGSVTVFPVLPDGRLGESTDFVRHVGSSVNPDRQKGPHAHSINIAPDGRFVLVADLGLDQVIVYPLDAAKAKLGAPQHVVKVHPGYGPRHMVFAPDGKFVYLLNEMASTVTAFSYRVETGDMGEVQTISTLPQDFSGTSTAAEIQLSPTTGRFLYASNRGDDSIVVFDVNHAKGTLTFVQRISTGGKSPRNFAIDPTGTWLLAANQNSNNIVTFHIDPKTGWLKPMGKPVQLTSPVCIQFVRLP